MGTRLSGHPPGLVLCLVGSLTQLEASWKGQLASQQEVFQILSPCTSPEPHPRSAGLGPRDRRQPHPAPASLCLLLSQAVPAWKAALFHPARENHFFQTEASGPFPLSLQLCPHSELSLQTPRFCVEVAPSPERPAQGSSSPRLSRGAWRGEGAAERGTHLLRSSTALVFPPPGFPHRHQLSLASLPLFSEIKPEKGYF